MLKNPGQFFASLLILLALLAGDFAHAENVPEIIVVARKQREVHRQLVNSLRQQLEKFSTAKVRIVNPAGLKRMMLNQKNRVSSSLIVSVGTGVTQKILAMKPPTPVLSVAIPRASFQRLKQRFANSVTSSHTLSAIYLDQPVERRFALVQQILPKARRVAIVLGPDSVDFEQQIKRAAKHRNLQIQLGKVTSEDELVKTLDQVLENSDVMLGLVDPLVFSRASARNILLTAYRWRVPLVGISPAYVRAGALAAVYSTPQQIAQQTAETLRQYFANPQLSMPAQQYPRYFSVAINYQVADSIGVQIDNEQKLKRQLADQAGEP